MSRQQQGFTLIELMVATAISAVIAVLAYQSVSQVTTLKSQVMTQQQRLTELQRTHWQLQQDFMQMVPRPITDAMGTLLPAVVLQAGEEVSLSRLAETSIPDLGQKTGLLRVDYRLEAGKLYRWVWPVLDRSPDSQPQKILLLTGVEDFKVQFFDAKQTPQTIWPPLSDATALGLRALPLGVSVQLKLLRVPQTDSVHSADSVQVRWFFAGVDSLPAEQGFQKKGSGR